MELTAAMLLECERLFSSHDPKWDILVGTGGCDHGTGLVFDAYDIVGGISSCGCFKQNLNEFMPLIYEKMPKMSEELRSFFLSCPHVKIAYRKKLAWGVV